MEKAAETRKRIARVMAVFLAAVVCLGFAPQLDDGLTAQAAAKPSTATIAKASSPSKGKLKVAVKKVKGASGYQVKISSTKRFKAKTTRTLASKKTTITTKGLAGGKTYYVKARAYVTTKSGKTYGNWSKLKTARVSNGVGKTAVTKLSQSSGGNLSVKVKKATGANRYQVAVSQSKKFPSKSTKTNTAKGTTISLKGLQANKTYYVRARGCKVSGKAKAYGAWSSVKTVKINKASVSFSKLSPVQLVAKVKSYKYSVKPVNGKLNNIVFVQTNNPDPTSIQLVDEKSKYLKKGEKAVFKPLSTTYRDVVYSNAQTRRIANKGYLFYCYNCNSDGGTLKVMANKGQYERREGNVTYSSEGQNYATGKTATCPALEDRVDYLIRTYAAGQTGFFNKLSAVEGGLTQIALYPKSLLNSDKRNKNGYPCLAASPYAELGLNKHIESMYQYDTQGLFISAAYGFCLDSLSYPGMIGSVAKRLQPSCKVAGNANYHWLIDVTWQGATQSYGGAGEGTTNRIYSKFVQKTFKFDGTDKGFGTNPSLSAMRAKRLEYAKKSDEFAEASLAKLSNDSVKNVVGDGAWIRCAREGWGGAVLCYVGNAPDGGIFYASDAWVDGRYVSKWESYVSGETFSSHPTADIILHGVSYVDINGVSHKNTVKFEYDDKRDRWSAPYYYNGAYWYNTSILDQLPDSLVLTRAEVNAMVAQGKIDGKTATAPAAKYIYDGSAEPGTPVGAAARAVSAMADDATGLMAAESTNLAAA